MSNVRVLVSDKLAEAGLRVLREAPGVELEFRPGMSEDELCSVIGDYDGEQRYHVATNAALEHAAEVLRRRLDLAWLPTPGLARSSAPERLAACDGVLAAPCSPYDSFEGGIAAIRTARERGLPLVGT